MVALKRRNEEMFRVYFALSLAKNSGRSFVVHWSTSVHAEKIETLRSLTLSEKSLIGRHSALCFLFPRNARLLNFFARRTISAEHSCGMTAS